MPRSEAGWLVGLEKPKVASLMCLAVGTDYYLRCIGSPSSSSSLAQLAYTVGARLQQSKVEADVYGDLNLELTEHHFSCSEFAWHHFCCILSVYANHRASLHSREERLPLGRTGSFHQVTLTRTGDVMIRRGVK